MYPFIYWWTFGLFVPFGSYDLWVFVLSTCFLFFFNSLGHMHRRGIAGSYGSSMLNFLRNYQTFYTAAPFLPAVHEGSNFSTPWLLFIIYYLSLWVLSYISLGFWLTFLWWIMILSIFSCAYSPFVYLWRNVYLSTLVVCLLLLSCKSLYIFWVPNIWFAKIFSHSVGCLFSSLIM